MRKIRMMLFMAIAAVMSIISMGAEITFRVDMTVLWNGPLPKNVYIFPARTDGGKDSGMTQNGKTIELNYNESIRNNAKEQEIGGAIILSDSDLDGIYEGKVIATKTHDFNSRLYISPKDDNNNMGNPIYEISSDNGEENADWMGWSKRYFKTDSTKTINWAWEEKYIYNFESLKNSPNTAGNTDKNNPGILEIQRGFSKRLILNAAFVNDEKVNRDVSKFVVMKEGDKNIADIEKIKDGSNISYVKIVAKGKKGDSTVIGLRVGDDSDPESGRYKIYYIKVVITDATSSSYTGEQTLIAKFNDAIATGDKIGLDENMQTINGYDPRFAGLVYDTTESIINDSYSNPCLLNLASQSYGEGYKWWLPGITGNGLIIPLGKRSTETTKKTDYPNGVYLVGDFNGWKTDLTKMNLVEDNKREVKIDLELNAEFKVYAGTVHYPSGGNWKVTDATGGAGSYLVKFDEKTKDVNAVKDGKETEIALVGIDSKIPFKSDVKIKKINEITNRETAMDIKMPKVIDSTKIKAKGGIAPSFEWEEDKSNSTDYSDRYIIARISKIKTSLALTKLDPYAGKNPIINAAKDTSAVGKFDSGSYAYIDYVFKGTGTEISSDGRAVKKEEYSGELVQKITVMNFPIGEYKVQIYSIKRGKLSNNYSVLTFETEQAFEITREDYESDATSTEDSYMIYGVNPSRFDEIAVRFVTKTQKSITDTEMETRIVYEENSTTASGIKEFVEGSDKKYGTGKNNKEKLQDGEGKGKLFSIKKIEDDKTNQMPLDVILCLDRSHSMDGKMNSVKAAWGQFENMMKSKGFSVGYRAISFYDGQLKEETTEWRTTLLANEGDNLTNYFKKFDDSDNGPGGYEWSAQAVNSASDLMASKGRYYGYDGTKGSWGPVQNKTNITSQKIIVFITDSNPTYSPSNDLEEKIRGQNITLVGLGMVKDETGNKLIVDSLGYDAEYPPDSGSHHSGKIANSYYDLKILLGNKFGWYQVSNDSARMFKQLSDGVKGIASTAVWELKYRTPFNAPDETRRRVDFYIKNMDNKTMVYTGTEEDRIYKAPKMSITVKIETPETDKVFLEADGLKYGISGEAFGEIEFDNPDIDKLVEEKYRYRDLKNAKLIIKKSGTEDLIKLDVAKSKEELWNEFKDNKEKISGGELGYKFKFEVPQENFIDSGAELFDVWVYAYMKPVGDDNWTCEPGSANAKRVKADVDPPKVIEVSMYNKTAAESIKDMQISDKKDKVFNEADIVNLNTLLYTPFESDSFNKETGTTVTQNFSDRVDKKSKDGRFVKDGSEINIKAVIIDANIDKDNLNKSSTKNVIKASFTNLGIETGYIAPDIIKYGDAITVGEESIKPIVAEWKIEVKNDTKEKDVIANMNILAIDRYSNSNQSESKVTNRLGNIQIAMIDNTKPGLGSFDGEIKAMTGSYGLYSFKTGKITKDSYGIDVNILSENLKDSNGIRAFKVYYTYDSKFSDYGIAGRTGKTGNHDNDVNDGDKVNYFYVKAGDGINLKDDSIEIEKLKGSAVKTPIKIENNHGDDGKYIFKIAAVDKAGNETDITDGRPMIVADAIEDKSFGNPKTIYVDTQAPAITNVVLRKDPKDNDGICTDNFVKKNDKAHIYADVEDYSAVASSVGSYENYYKGTGYPAYRAITMKDETPKITVSGTKSNTDTEKTKLNLRIGDTEGSNGNYLIVSVTAQEGNQGLVTIGAKDLAGNETKVTIAPTVDNKITTPVLKAYSLEGKNKNYTDVSQSIQDIDGAEPTSTNVHFTKHSSYILNVSNMDADVVSGELVHNTNYKTSGIVKDGNYPVSELGYLIPNYLNNAKLTVSDKAGNQAESNLAEIVVDTLVGNGNGIVTKETTAERVGSNVYKIKMNFIGLGNEYAGIQKYRITGSYSGKYTEYGAVAKTGNTPLKTGQSWSISPTINLTVPSDKVGTIVYIPGVLVDNLGNERIFNYKVLLPGKDINLKAQEIGSEKEIRTKVRVIDEKGNVDLQKSEETGKKAVKPPKKK